MKFSEMEQILDGLKQSKQMPVLFVGHGNPMNAIEDNHFSMTWREVGKKLPKPKAILCISAHWETWGTAVTAMQQPRTIHDFGGFPAELYAAEYPANGSPELAKKVKGIYQDIEVGLNNDWGLDHGCWSVHKQMFPLADIPVVQMSLDYTQPATYHYEMGKELAGLRKEGILILGSGNMVHNLRRMALVGEDFNEPFSFDWAQEANHTFKKLIAEDRHEELANYQSISEEVLLAIPTPEHYLPLLYSLAVKQPGDEQAIFNDQLMVGSVSMTSLLIGGA